MITHRIIGIDFGTSTSVVRIKRYQGGHPVGDRLYTEEVKFDSTGLVPTLIRHMQEGAPYYGHDAQKPRKKSDLFQSFKVDLESVDVQVKERARALTKEFFAYMAKQYKDQRSFFGDEDDIEKTIVSYPVKWSDETRQFMLEAARKAGFPNVEGMDEAQAAITAVMVQSADSLSKRGYLYEGQPVNILMADMGAGTTDLVLCRYTPGVDSKYEVLSTWPKGGSTLFGGREMEGLLRKYMQSKLPEEEADIVMKRCGIEKFKSWKESYVSPALKRNEAVTDFYEMDEIAEMLEIDMEEYSLDRTELEQFALNYLRGFPRLVSGCLKDAGITGSEVDLVLLTGGHSQWYFVAEQLTGKLSQCGEIQLPKIQADPDRIIPVSRPHETVALGLVYSPLIEQISFQPKPEQKSAPDSRLKIQSVSQPETKAASNIKTETRSITYQVKANSESKVWSESMRQLVVTPEDEFSFREIEGGYEVAEYLGHRESVSIPSVYKGEPVVAVGESAFNKGKGRAIELKEIEVPGSCYEIKRFAFYRNRNNRSLEKVILHCGLKSIGDTAFDNNINLLSVELPEGLERIGDYAFCNCNFKKVHIPKSCREIEYMAFSCKELTEVLFEPDAKIEDLRRDAFLNSNVNFYKITKGLPLQQVNKKL